VLALVGLSGAPAQAARSTGAVTIGTATHAVAGRNIARGVDQLVVYTSPTTVTPTNQWGAEVTVVGGTVTAVNNRQASQSLTGTRVPADGYVLSGHNTAMDWLIANARTGATVTLSGSTTRPPPRPVTHRNPVVRVMPMGDSITQAGGTAMGYKGYLLGRLLAAGERVNYVGSQVATGPAGLRDRDHEGHSGWQNSNFQPTARGYVATYRPDVVIYHVGTNDIWSNIDATTAIVRLRDVLTKIYAARPGTRVVLAEIVRMNVGKNAQWRSYNRRIPGVVSDFRSRGRRISLADLSATLTIADLQADGIHPSDAGHRKMARAFYPVVKAAIDRVR
jgi:lysophospholipase L1-like esterase